MFNKIKKGLTDAKDKAGRNIEYQKGKSSGFQHPEQVEPYVQILVANMEQIPKLIKRIESLCKHIKALSTTENKAYDVFSTLGGHDKENPQLEQYMKAYSEHLYRVTELRSVLHAKLDEIRADMKMIETRELKELNLMYEKTNRALTDAKYWRSHSNPVKLQEAESKYKQFSVELVDMINRLVEIKETQFPEYLRKISEMEIEFNEKCLDSARQYYGRLAQIGPVIVTKGKSLNINFDLGSSEFSNTSTSTYSQPPPNYSSNPVVPPPKNTPPLPSARIVVALYDFNASNPDELSFRAGDRIEIIEQNGPWWKGVLNGKVGMIPSNYVQ